MPAGSTCPIMASVSADWRAFDAPQLQQHGCAVWISHGDEDTTWDAFLLGTELGQFQQSTAWARVKRIEGWQASRVIVTHGVQVIGGFQVLWRARFGIRLGYVTKGPVLSNAIVPLRDEVVRLMRAAANVLGLRAMVVQAPDFDTQLEQPMIAAGLPPHRLQDIYSATVFVDVTQPIDEIVRGFSRDVMRLVRRQRDEGVSTRWGGPEDAELFFALMAQTCAKQRVSPNPPNADAVRAILRAFSSPSETGRAKASVLFAEHQGRTLAAFLLIRFGERLVLWKKGALADGGRLQPNRLLDFEAIQWARSIGCRQYELVGLHRGAAVRLLAGARRADVSMPSADAYKLNFGGSIKLLPEARILLPSRLCSLGYHALALCARRGDSNPARPTPTA